MNLASVRKFASKVVLVLVLGVLVVLLMLYLNGSFTHKVSPQPAPSAAPPAVSPTFEVRFIEIPNAELAPGTIRPLHEMALASKVAQPEKVVEMNVAAGQAVKSGQVLAKLDTTFWQNRKEMAEAHLRSAQAARQDAAANLARVQEASAKGAATATELDSARFRMESSEADLITAKRALDEANLNLGYTQIVSPVEAVVIDKLVDVGDTVSPGQPLVKLYDKMQLTADVREGLIKHLQAGQNVGVRIEELGAACVGTISEIVPEANPATRTFLVKVVGPCQSGVRPGMYAKLVVPLGLRQVLVIPPQAVIQVGQLTMVDVAAPAGGKTIRERRQVQLGERLDFEGRGYVEVLSGLKAGEVIFTPAAEPEPASQSAPQTQAAEAEGSNVQ